MTVLRQSLSVVTLATIAFAPAGALAQGGPALVKVDQVKTEPLSQTVPVLGRVVARQQGPVATRVAGAVAEVKVEVGDRVEAGEVLALLVDERRRYERELALSELAAAEAQQKTADAELGLRRQEFRRLESLTGSAAFSRARLDDKRQEIVVAQGRLSESAQRMQMAKARLNLADWDLEQTRVLAPYPGVVNVKHVSAGAFVGVGDPIVTLIDDSGLEVEADVPTERVAALKPGTEIGIRLDDGSLHGASVRAVVPRENPLTRTRAVRFLPAFGDVARPLAIDQSVTLNLPIGVARDVVTVHKDAVIKRQGGALVYIVLDGKAEIRPVRLGEAVAGRFEVLSGLKPGDVVVIRGNERLRPGQPVQPDKTGAAAGAVTGPKRDAS